MINVLRKNQKGLWIVICLLCIPFVFYFSKSDMSRIAKNDLGRIYGRTVSNVEFQRSARLFNLARDLGMYNYLQDMVAGATSQSQAYVDFAWNRIILHHEAEQLGVTPSRDDIVAAVKGLMAFRGAQGFDINKYNEFTEHLSGMGFGETQIEELVSEQLSLARLKEIISVGATVPESETRENYNRAYGKLNIAVARVRSEDVAKNVQVSDDDVSKYYEAHKAELNSEEKRKVSFVTFGLNDEQKKLAGKERVEVLQKLADHANDFNQALLETGAQFEQVAAKFQLPIQNSGEFTKAKPDPLLNASPQLSEAAFQLTAQDPTSDALQGGDSFYVLHLGGIDAAQPLSLEQAKPKIVETMKSQRVKEMVAAKGAEAAQKIREALKSGTPLDAALQQCGLPTEKIPAFALADPPAMKTEPEQKPEPQPEGPDMPMIKGAVAEMNAGEVSEFLPTEAGGVVAVLEKRDAPDPAKYEQAKELFSMRVARGKRDLAFFEWLSERRREAGVRSPVAGPNEIDAG